MTVKLTNAQLVMLGAAAHRENLCLTVPDKMKGAVLSKASEKLVKLGLVREVRAKAGLRVWRREEGGQSYALKLTAAGLKAIAVVAPGEARQPPPNPNTSNASGPGAIGEHAKTVPPRAGSKLARVIDLLQRSDGATLSDMTEATGWRCQSNGGSSTCGSIAISRAVVYAARARHSAKAAERLCL